LLDRLISLLIELLVPTGERSDWRTLYSYPAPPINPVFLKIVLYCLIFWVNVL